MGFIIPLIILKVLNISPKIIFYTDSQLVYKQIIGQYKVKKPHILALNYIANKLFHQFSNIKIEHVLREQNTQADFLANLGKSQPQNHFEISF